MRYTKKGQVETKGANFEKRGKFKGTKVALNRWFSRVRPALNTRKFRRQGGQSPLEPPYYNVQYSILAATR
eukprot:COSAG06_NODE_1118_length_10635_cov_5.052946_7_plen_71_part_00